MGREVRIGLRNEDEARRLVVSVEVAVLEAPTANDAVRATFPNLLDLSGVNFDIAAVAEGDVVLIDVDKSAVSIDFAVNDWLGGIGGSEGVLQTASEK